MSVVNALFGLTTFGGQSAPPSLKCLRGHTQTLITALFRGAVRPPFIEASSKASMALHSNSFGGQSAPPSLKRLFAAYAEPSSFPFGGQSAPPSLKQGRATCRLENAVALSGGSPPPLH